MIVDFQDDWLREFFTQDVAGKRIPSEIRDRLFRKLQMLDDASSDADLFSLPSNHFEKLRGILPGWHSIRINDQWRLIFQWHSEHGEAHNVYIDNHSYR